MVDTLRATYLPVEIQKKGDKRIKSPFSIFLPMLIAPYIVTKRYG